METFPPISAYPSLSPEEEKGILAFAIGFGLLSIILTLVSLGLGIWALIDAAMRRFNNSSHRTIWIVLIVFAILGQFLLPIPIIPIIYLIWGRKGGTISQGQNSQTPTTTNPPQTGI